MYLSARCVNYLFVIENNLSKGNIIESYYLRYRKSTFSVFLYFFQIMSINGNKISIMRRDFFFSGKVMIRTIEINKYTKKK